MATDKESLYKQVIQNIKALIEGETDEIAIMATVACELHHQFDYFDWTGFYRVVEPELLKVGPYQGTHGCLQIPFSRGVCGAAARTQSVQLISDVSKVEDHIACASTTQSEIVLPVFNPDKALVAVLDVDSNQLNTFDETDQSCLEQICKILSEHLP